MVVVKSFHTLFKFRYLWLIMFIAGSIFLLQTTLSKGSNLTVPIVPIPHMRFKSLESQEIFIYVVTPTYGRPVQKAELTRLSQTLRLVPNVFWIMVEDSEQPTNVVTNLLKKSKLPHVQLIQPTPASWKIKNNEGHWTKPRGVLQRNQGIAWIRENVNHDRGVIYFADDDNTYSDELFEEIRSVKGVGVWPVGLVGGLMVERPLVQKGRVVGFNAGWRSDRTFPIDMAGFAVSLKLLKKYPNAKFSLTSEGGFQETDFLSQLTTRADLEPKADNCTKVFVWHTRTENPKLIYEERLKRQGKSPSNLGIEV